MTKPNRLRRAILLGVLLIGITGAFAAAGTGANFTDSHLGQASVTADTNFGGGGGPQADAGGSYTVGEGGDIYLDASGSTTSQGTITTYSWDLVSGPGGGWYYPSQPWAVFEAPDDVNGTTKAVVKLTITTNQGLTDTDYATITIQDTSGTSTSGSPPGTNGNSGPQTNSQSRQTFGN